MNKNTRLFFFHPTIISKFLFDAELINNHVVSCTLRPKRKVPQNKAIFKNYFIWHLLKYVTIFGVKLLL